MELARGQIGDRPWGRTLAAIGLRGVACEVVLHASDGKEYRIAFHGEGVVGAASPLGPDSALQIALTHKYAQTAHIPFIHHKLGADPDRDELEIIAEIARLDPDQALRMRLRAIAQCATRTFAIPEGIFTVQSDITLPVHEGAAVDIRAVVYAGARTHYDADRLLAEVHRFGTHFMLKPEAIDDVGQFGFQRAERELIEPLLVGCNLEELESLHAQLPPTTTRAAVYALVACGAATASEPIAFTRAPTPTETAIPIVVVGESTTRSRAATATSEHIVGDLMEAPVAHARPPQNTVPDIKLPSTSELADVLTALDTDQGMSQVPPLPVSNDLVDLYAGNGEAAMIADEQTPVPILSMPPAPEPAPPMHMPRAPSVGVAELIAGEIGQSDAPAPPSLLAEVDQFAPEDRLRRATKPPTTPPYQPHGQGEPPPGQWAQPAPPPYQPHGQGEPPPGQWAQPAPPPGWQPAPASAWQEPPQNWQGQPVDPRLQQPQPWAAPPAQPAQHGSGGWPPQPPQPAPEIAVGRTPTPAAMQPPPSATAPGRPPIVPVAHKPMPRSGVSTSPPATRTPSATTPPRTASSTTPPTIASKVPGLHPILPPGSGPSAMTSSIALSLASSPPSPPSTASPPPPSPSSPPPSPSSSPSPSPPPMTPNPDDPASASSSMPASPGVPAPPGRGPARTPQQLAAEHTKQGMLFLRDGHLTKAVEELQRATDYDSSDPDNYARLAWAKFCAATDKKVAAVAARKVLGHAAHKSQKPEVALFYLGRVERMCGRDREALEHFQQVVFNEPKHAEALAEIRVIERNLAAEKAASSGLGGLFKKKK